MKKLLALASVVSAVALAANASAEQWSLALSGNVPAFVSVTSTSDAGCTTGTCTFSGTDTAQIVSLVTFADADGIVNATAGGATVNVDSNAAFTASLASSNGSLSNTVHGTTVAYNIQLANNTPGDANTPQTKNYAHAVGATAIPIAFSVPPGSSAVAEGEYADTLTLTLMPTV